MLYTIVFAGIPIGVAYAKELAITIAASTAFESKPSWAAKLRSIGTNNAQVAVLDIKFVINTPSTKITTSTTIGDGLAPTVKINTSAEVHFFQEGTPHNEII